MHLLVIMHGEDKPNTAEKTDKVIWAEIPPERDNKDLHKKVMRHMIHGPCKGNPNYVCMEVGDDGQKRCGKEFPKAFEERTIVDGDNYPVYRRRSPEDGGLCRVKEVKNDKGELVLRVVDNSYVVPYNPYLLQKYDCHLNVENVNSIHAVKYLYKYVTKGQDRASFAALEEGPDGKLVVDEIQSYLDGRYISSSLALWRLYEFGLHEKFPPVSKLPVHLPGEQTVLFSNLEDMQRATVAQPDTKLTAYFDFMRNEGELAADIQYEEVHQFCVWESKQKCWRWRSKMRGPGFIDEKGRKVHMHLGRIPFFRPNREDQERFYLRMLLLERPASSFEALRTVGDETFDTFKEACVKLGLLNNDNELDGIMQEVGSFQMPRTVRKTFVALLLHMTPSDCPGLFERHLGILSDDVRRKAESEGLYADQPQLLEGYLRNKTLAILKDLLEVAGSTLGNFHLKEPEPEYVDPRPALLRREEILDPLVLAELRAEVAELEGKLTDEQRAVYDAVASNFADVEDEGPLPPELFSLNACGGSGKTFILNLLLKKVRSMGKIALAVAFSGIAATLLDNGCTVHSRFKAPLHLKEDSVCSITPRSILAKLINRASLLIVDEVRMNALFYLWGSSRRVHFTSGDHGQQVALRGGGPHPPRHLQDGRSLRWDRHRPRGRLAPDPPRGAGREQG